MARTQFALAFAIGCWLLGAPVHAGVPPLTQPNWSELTPEQKRVLAPLAAEWNQMSTFRRKKWLGVAQRYKSLRPEEQARMQRRMSEWARLTPEERKQARDEYKTLQKAPPERKAEVRQKWQEYKELPDSEKARLKAEANAKPASGRAPVLARPAEKSPPPSAAPIQAPTLVAPSATQ